MLISSERINEDPKTSLLTISSANKQPVGLRKGLAITGAALSIIAVSAVPYLVMRSIFYLAVRQENFTFKEMIHTDKVVFWLFGPTTALIATIAIAPFNMYNAYQTVINIQLNKRAFSYLRFLQWIVSPFLTFTGAVNGFNTNSAINDIWPNYSAGKLAIQYPMVAISILFAGISDARVFLDYLQKDLIRDFRYLKRGSQFTYRLVKKHIPFFKNTRNIQATPEINRKLLLQQIRCHLDDLKMIILLALTDTEINQLKELHEDQSWINDINSSDAERYLQIFSKQFPVGRFLGSEIFGSIISGLWAYYGNKNTFEYTYKAVSSFLINWGANREGLFLRFANGFASTVAYVIGFFVSFFLIRDLFFRDIFKATTWPEFKARLPKLLIPIIPALSFGLLNVILTVLNDSLSPLEKILVSCSAIIGATVVTRYGIEGGIEQLSNKPNIRRELAYSTDALMEQLIYLEFEELVKLHDKIGQIKVSLQTIIAKDKKEYQRVAIDDSEEVTTSEEIVTIKYGHHQ